MEACIIGSSKSRVRSISAAKSITNNRMLDFTVMFEQDTGADTGAIWFLDSGDASLSAVTMNRSAVQDSEDWTEEDWQDHWEEMLSEKGSEGFNALLLEMAPLLETPLTAFSAFGAFAESKGYCSVSLVTVRPGATQVEVQSFDTSTIQGVI